MNKYHITLKKNQRNFFSEVFLVIKRNAAFQKYPIFNTCFSGATFGYKTFTTIFLSISITYPINGKAKKSDLLRKEYT